MWDYVAAIGWPQSQQNASDCWAAQGSQQNALAAQYANQYNHLANRPGGVVFHEPAAKDCEGCGAPGVRYAHHCEYCKRPR